MVSFASKTCKSVDPKEECLVDLDASIQESRLTLGTLDHIKQVIMDNSNIILDIFCSSLSQFTFEPTFPYLEFVHWTVQNYVPSTKQILSADGSRVIFTLNSETLRKTLCLPFENPDAIQFSEEKSLATINAFDLDQLYIFMSKMFRPDINPSKFSFPYDISLFSQTLQAVFSLLSQILGLQDDKLVIEIMVGIVCLVSQSTKDFNLSFD